MQHLQPNTTLQGGKYRIEQVLGQGGFGITYLALQTSLQRKVAIKEFFMKDFCVRDEGTQTMTAPSTGGKFVEQYKKKFVKEARNLARLNHPHIISVIDVFEENGTIYYAMPYLAGGSLQDYVKAHGTLSETEALKYIRQIANALKYMHETEHICHYDVKPANILLDDKGNAILIDFGISKNYDAAGHETTTTPIGMSEGYAPIEQYQQNVEEFSPASDVYALGATLYFLLHGKRPVSAIHRASGTELIMSKSLSQVVKDIINDSMKISKRERANSVGVFLKDVLISGSGSKSVIDDEETMVAGKTTNNDDSNNNGGSSNAVIYLLLGILMIFVVFFIIAFPYKKSEGGIFCDVDSVSVIESFVLKGKVNNTPFTMHLSLNGNDVEGTEHYDNQRKDAIIDIKGTIDDNGTMTLYEYIGNENTGIYTGTFGTDSYSGTFSNKNGKEFAFSSVIMNEDEVEEWKSTQFETSFFSYRKNANGIDVEMKADYPIKGNEELLGKTRLFVAGAIEKFFDIDTQVADLLDGQALLNHSGSIKYKALKKEKDEAGDSYGWEETINIQKNYENEKCVSFCVSSLSCHGGVGNSFRIGATFRKEDGKRIVVLKDSYNSDLWLLIKQEVKKELGDDYEMIDEDFETSPMPDALPYLTKGGVQFDYQHYEIGPGVLGQICIVIPYEKIKMYMSDEAKQLVY